MDRKRLRVLLIDDSPSDAERLLRELVSGGYDPLAKRVEDAQALSRALQGGTWDLAICDYSMPRFSGADALRSVQETDPDLPFLFVSGTLPEELARKLKADGAAGVLSKDNLASFLPAIELTNTMRPRAARSMGSTACVTATCPTTLTSSCRRSS